MNTIDLAKSGIKGQEVLISLSKNLPTDSTKTENYKQLVDTFHKTLEKFQKDLSRVSGNDCYYDSDAHILGTSEIETFHKVSKENCLNDYTTHAIHQFVKSLIPFYVKEEDHEAVAQFLSDKFQTASNSQSEIFFMLRNQIPLGSYGLSKEQLIKRKEDLSRKLEEIKKIEDDISLNWKKELESIIKQLEELENQVKKEIENPVENELKNPGSQEKSQKEALNETIDNISPLMVDLKKIENFEELRAKRIATRGVDTGISSNGPSKIKISINDFNDSYFSFMRKNFPNDLAKKKIINMELTNIDRMLNSQIMPLTPLKPEKEQSAVIKFSSPPEVFFVPKINTECATPTPKLLDIGGVQIKKVSCCNRLLNFFKRIFVYLCSCFYRKSKKTS